MTATSYRVTLSIREAERTVSAATEREVALMAESILRQHEHQRLAVGFRVDCADPAARHRIAAYLADLALELDLA
ncbi:hypothetical protein [Methylobacterium oxalidis]|nr:hypothetical protein [Methylobacterium oxalidis]GEP05308.1 hypothetical protein MOX02_33460 [Methylobacterium oxalidis]GJE31319.1 hypothetical protein LDDCCGHA_1496 [Methylobacterium oxalidis]